MSAVEPGDFEKDWLIRKLNVFAAADQLKRYVAGAALTAK